MKPPPAAALHPRPLLPMPPGWVNLCCHRRVCTCDPESPLYPPAVPNERPRRPALSFDAVIRMLGGEGL